MADRRFSPAALLEGLPGYVAGVALLVVAARRFVSGMQPGESPSDMRPLGDVSNGLAALVGGVALILLARFAAKPGAPRSSLLTTACLAAAAAAILAFAAARSHSGLLLALAVAFAYPALVASARLVQARRAAREERS